MIQNGRPKDDGFRPRDHLYYRCKKEDVIGDRVNPNRLRSLDISVNWSKYSKPWDVIFDFVGYGIARFVVRDLPQELPKEKPAKQEVKLISFVPAHVPEENNYGHSEIWAMKDGGKVEKTSQIGDTAKKEFRQIMSDRSLVLHPPEI